MTVIVTLRPLDDWAVPTKTFVNVDGSWITHQKTRPGEWFQAYEVPINSLHDLYDHLDLIKNEPVFIVSGELVKDGSIDPKRMRRITSPKESHPASIKNHQIKYLPLDIDGYKCDLPVDDPQSKVENYIRKELPKEFHDCDYIFQTSASYGITNTELRAHVFFELVHPISNESAIEWTKSIYKLDKSVVECYQPIYTQNRKIIGEVPDPCPPVLEFVKKEGSLVYEFPSVATSSNSKVSEKIKTQTMSGRSQEELVTSIVQCRHPVHESIRDWIKGQVCDSNRQHGHILGDLMGMTSVWSSMDVDKEHLSYKGDFDRQVKVAINKYRKNETNSEWELPEPLEVSITDIEQIKFPIEVLPDNLRIAAQEIADYNLCSIHDIALSMFPVISAAIGRKVLVQAGTPGIEVYPNLGVINIAETGAYKSTVNKLLSKSLMDAINDKIAVYNKEAPLLRSKIAILDKKIKDADAAAAKDASSTGDLKMIFKKLAESNSDRDELERLTSYRNPNTIADDTTMEQMAVQGFESGGEILIMSSEGQAIFRALADSYSSNKSNTDLLIKGLSGDLFTRGRIGSATNNLKQKSISYVPVINMSFFVQPDIYRDQFSYNASISSSGLTARIITHMWNIDFTKTKNDDNYDIDESKLKPYWDSVYDIAMVDDRNEKYKGQTIETIDSNNYNMIKPICKIKYDTRYKQVYLNTFNEIRQKQVRGGELEGKGDIINKCLTLSYSIAACINIVKIGSKFFDSSVQTFDTEDMSNVDKIVKYLIEKKLVEHRVIESYSKIASAKILLKVLTRRSQLENSLNGLTTFYFDRLTKTSKHSLKKQYVDGEVILRDMGYLKLINDKIVLNPRWEEVFN